MSNKEENPQFSEWFSDTHIDDHGFSEQLYLSLVKRNEKRNRTSRIISMLITHGFCSRYLFSTLGAFNSHNFQNIRVFL